MALEGKIKEFGVADIVQLISQQQKTGILMVENMQGKAEVYFVDGQVVETRDFYPKNRDPLGEMLLKAELISVDQLKKSLQKQKDNYDHLGQILIRDGLVSKENLEKAILTQVYETFYDILQWRDGSYRFVAGKVNINTRLSFMPGLESILLDVFRMIDEWPEVKQIIPSFDMVFAGVEEKNPAGIGREESLVYDLIDGTNTVQEVIDKSLQGRFAVCKTIVELLQQGYVNLTSAKAKKRVESGKAFLQKAVGFALYTGLLIVLCLMFYFSSGLPGTILPILSPDNLNHSYLKSYFVHNRIQQLKNALEIFRLKNGEYPETIYQIKSAGIFRDNDLKAYLDGSIIYSKKGDTYIIR